MRRRILKRLLPKCHCVQIRNPQCSQSRCHPLWGQTIQISWSIQIQKANIHWSLPELSSLTSDDIVLVMESAAMRRSFLRFLRGPWKHGDNKKFLHQHLDTSMTMGVTVIPWVKASWTSPPTPMSESWGVCVGVVTAESEWMGVGMERLMVWLGEERGEPGPWVCSTESLFYFSWFCSEFLIWPPLGIKSTGVGCVIIVSHIWNEYFTQEYLYSEKIALLTRKFNLYSHH